MFDRQAEIAGSELAKATSAPVSGNSHSRGSFSTAACCLGARASTTRSPCGLAGLAAKLQSSPGLRLAGQCHGGTLSRIRSPCLGRAENSRANFLAGFVASLGRASTRRASTEKAQPESCRGRSTVHKSSQTFAAKSREWFFKFKRVAGSTRCTTNTWGCTTNIWGSKSFRSSG
jgi:hypothetical protein